MSVILDALNKAEEERKKVSARIHSHFGMHAPKKRVAYYIVFGGTAACVALTVFLVPVLFKARPVLSEKVMTAKNVNLPAPQLNPALAVQPDSPPPASTESGQQGAKAPSVAVPASVSPPIGDAANNRQGEKVDKSNGSAKQEKPKRPEKQQKRLIIADLSKKRPQPDVRKELPDPGEADFVESRIVVKTIDDDKITTLYNLAVREAEKGNLGAAKKLYDDILAERPTHTEAMNNLGVIAMKEGNSRQAVTYFRKCLSYRPDYQKAYNNLGLALLKEGDREQAEGYFRTSIRLDKDSVEPYLNLVSLLRSEKRFDEALEVLQAPISAYTKEPAIYLSLAIIKDEMQDYKDAIKCYRRYLSLGGKREENVIERLKFLEENQSAKGR